MNVKIEAGWKAVLQEEFDKPYFGEIARFIRQEITNKTIVYPPGHLIFSAFDKTPFDKVKVVILGQDPYHGNGQANGLCFSVQRGLQAPPSLVNIFTELHTDLGIERPGHGCLEQWAAEGVLLLNTVLTVQSGQPMSHSKIGWQQFTDAVICKLSEQKNGLVFLLWGNPARAKKTLIDATRHFVLEAAHPSPLAGGRFFGSRPFSKTNELLQQQGLAPINWQLT